MPEIANTHRTCRGNVTLALPGSTRDRRIAKAIAVVKAMPPPKPEAPVFVPYVAPVPDATFTYYGKAAGTRITTSVVYFMYSCGRVKIGVSVGLRDRHSNLKKSGAFPPILLLVIDGTEKDERKLHQRFAEDRLHGEWFSLSRKLKTYIRTRLCDIGLASFDAAERNFRDACEGFLASYREPKPRPPRELCNHNIPQHHTCAACDRERDLRIIQEINSKLEAQP